MYRMLIRTNDETPLKVNQKRKKTWENDIEKRREKKRGEKKKHALKSDNLIKSQSKSSRAHDKDGIPDMEPFQSDSLHSFIRFEYKSVDESHCAEPCSFCLVYKNMHHFSLFSLCLSPYGSRGREASFASTIYTESKWNGKCLSSKIWC